MNTDTVILAEKITQHSSLQTYITIKLLVDKSLQADCFKAYAYFRWLDDQVDIVSKTKLKRLNFISRQKLLIENCYQQKVVNNVIPEEKLITELINTDPKKQSKLGSFILNFFAIIEFDAHRKDTCVSQAELVWYRETLAKAVTDGIEHFINHEYTYPSSPHHYHAAIGAHIAHMLRDYCEDIPEGYINIPTEYLSKHHLQPADITQAAFKTWVKEQVELADQYFQVGKQYIHALPILRGKLAAAWYCARFEGLLHEIKRDQYLLHSCYDRRKHLANYFHMIRVAAQVTMNHFFKLYD